MEELPVSTSRQMAIGFFALLIVNSVVIWVANYFFPSFVVLGTANISLWWAVLHSMGTLALIGTLAVPAMEYIQEMQGRALTMKDWMIGYLVVNFVGIWVIARFSEQFGLGISAWWVALVVAVILDLVQGLAMMVVYRQSKEVVEEVTVVEVTEEPIDEEEMEELEEEME